MTLALLLALGAQAAVVNVQSPAMRQLEEIEGKRPDEEPTKEAAGAASSLGFTVKTLAPVGFVGEPPSPQPEEPQQAPGARPRYVFEGKTPMPGVSIYTPKPDPTGEGKTEAAPPKEGMGSGLMMYGGLAVGVGLVAAGVNPLIVFALVLAAAMAMLFVFNRKSA